MVHWSMNQWLFVQGSVRGTAWWHNNIEKPRTLISRCMYPH